MCTASKPSLTFLIILVALFALGCGGSTTTSSGDGSTSSGGGELSKEDEAKYYMEQAGLAVANEDPDTALANYIAAARTYDLIGDITVDRAESHFLAADLLYRLGDPTQALSQYQTAVDIYMRFSGNAKIKAAVSLNNMGSIYKELQRKDKARNCWENALQIYKAAPPELQNRTHMATIEQNINDLREGF